MGNEGTPPRELAPKYSPDQSDVTVDCSRAKKKQEPPKFHFCPEKGCNKSFSRPSRLETHILSHTGKRPFVCENPDCDKSFTRAAHLKRHEIVNHSGASTPKHNLECSYEKCEATFSNKYSLAKHVKRFHETKQYKCDRCEKSFHKHHLLRNHQREHTGSKPLECPSCEKAFEWPFELKRHIRSHRLKKCDICEAVFDKWSDLTLHKSFEHVHKHVIEIVNCDVCNKEFKYPHHLNQHRKIHGETRDVFHCTVKHCPRFYYFLYNLEHHIRSYHNGNKFPCDKCSKKLVSKQKLKEHIETVHASDVTKQKKSPPTGVNRKPRKDKGAFKKPSKMSGHKPMVSVLTGIDVTTAARDVLIEDTEVPIKDPKKIASEMQEFVGVPLGCETSDSEAVVGCKRTRADLEEFLDVDRTLMGVVKRIEQDKHFKKLKIGESEISSDTDLTDIENELKTGGVKKGDVKKPVNFSKYVRN